MWVLGDLDTHDRWCRCLARGADVEVLAVDYGSRPSIRGRRLSTTRWLS
jgi:acetyl esterase/lipase